MSDVAETIFGIAFVIFICCVSFVLGGLFVSKGIEEIKNDYESRIEYYEQVLDDPHHCVSVCAEQFEKMGC